MRGRSGIQIQRFVKDWHTDTPSIQGVWHPFMFKDTKLNVTDLRDRSLHEFRPTKTSATDKVQKLFKEQSKEEKLDDTVVPEKVQAASSS